MSSCVESGLEAHSATSAPPSRSVIIRLAVSLVTCRQAEMRMPFQRLVLDELLADELQDFHGLIGPFQAFLAQIGQFHALDIAGDLRGVLDISSYRRGVPDCCSVCRSRGARFRGRAIRPFPKLAKASAPRTPVKDLLVCLRPET